MLDRLPEPPSPDAAATRPRNHVSLLGLVDGFGDGSWILGCLEIVRYRPIAVVQNPPCMSPCTLKRLCFPDRDFSEFLAGRGNNVDVVVAVAVAVVSRHCCSGCVCMSSCQKAYRFAIRLTLYDKLPVRLNVFASWSWFLLLWRSSS